MKLSCLGFFLLLSLSINNVYSQNVQAIDISQSYGYLHFQFNVDTAYVQFGMNKPVIRKVANNDTVQVKNGFYHLYLSYPTNEDTYVTQNVLTDSLYTIRHDFDLTQDEIDLKSNNASIRYLIGGDVVAFSDDDTDINLNGVSPQRGVGVFTIDKPISKLSFRNEEFYTKTMEVKKEESVVFKNYYFYPTKDMNSFLSLVPGLSQLKRKEYVKTGIIFGFIITSTSYFMKYQKEYNRKIHNYNNIRNMYLSASNETKAERLGDEMEEASKEYILLNKKRNLGLAGIAVAVVYDVVDKIQYRKKMGFREAKSAEMILQPSFEKYLTVGARLKF